MPLQINEIMYDFKTGSDSGREWVEVWNNSDKYVDFSTYKFFEADTNHKLKLIQGDGKIAPQSYAVITEDGSKFKTDWPSFSGAIFDSSFSLSNDGEALALKDGEVVVDSYFYKSSLGGAGDGNSLQKINGMWQGAKPTPGTENKITYIPPPPKSASKPAPKLISKIQPPSSPLSGGEPSSRDSGRSGGVSIEVPIAAQAISAESTSFYFPITMLVFLISVGATAVYFIRRKRVIAEPDAEFEIEEI